MICQPHFLLNLYLELCYTRFMSDLPVEQGLYDPRHEHDACGIGFVVNIKGEQSHGIILKGLQILINLAHRGACGCDPETGDGAGILIQIPHKFFARECNALGFTLPPVGVYGVGMVFLPVEPSNRLLVEGILEKIAREEGLTVLGWRDTPVNADAIGRIARASQPYIEQIFIRGAAPMTQDELERKLYVVRRRAELEIAASDLPDKSFFYIPSLSSRTIIYKGLLLAPQIADFYNELTDPDAMSALCLVHQRFSTNTFPSWQLAHPYRYLCHNGEINTVRGNVNWMNARERVLSSPLFADDLKKVLPIIKPGGSDSAALDNALELLTLSGRRLPHAMAMLIPEAWDADDTMHPAKKAFYEYHASLMEPWDGPAAVAFTDGRSIGATLDRNGLRPARYLVTHDDLVIMASETGVLPVKPEDVKFKGRLQPGRMLLVDTTEGRIIPDEEIKERLWSSQPYGEWLKENQITLDSLPEPPRVYESDLDNIIERQRAFGYTDEDLARTAGPDGGECGRSGRVHGHRYSAGVSFGQAAVAVPLFQANVCAGDESRHRSDSRSTGDVAHQLHRNRAQYFGGDAGALSYAQASASGAHQSRSRKTAARFYECAAHNDVADAVSSWRR